MKNKYLLYAIIPAITLASLGSVAYANTNTGVNNPMSNLVTAISQKFNLNPVDVQKVFDEQKTQMNTAHQQKMAQTFTEKINKAVTAGKLTQAQANLIIAKKAELDAQKISLQGKTKAEIGAAVKAQMASLKQWATDNNIPMEYLRFGGFGKGIKHMVGFGEKKFAAPPTN